MRAGYPTKKELDKIKNWESENFMELIQYINSMYNYKMPQVKWIKDELRTWSLHVTIITSGWSGNEDIVDALLSNFAWGKIWHYKWQRGGKYEFLINPINAGYMLVSEFCKKHNISRQAIYQHKHLYAFIKVSNKIVFVKRIVNSNYSK